MKLCCLLSGWTCKGCNVNYGCQTCSPLAWSGSKHTFKYLCDYPVNQKEGCWPKYCRSKEFNRDFSKSHDTSIDEWIKNRQ